MKTKLKFTIDNVTFFYHKPPVIDILLLKKQVRDEGYAELENQEFLSRITDKYVKVRKGLFTKKVTAEFLQPYSWSFKEKFLNELTKILI